MPCNFILKDFDDLSITTVACGDLSLVFTVLIFSTYCTQNYFSYLIFIRRCLKFIFYLEAHIAIHKGKTHSIALISNTEGYDGGI